MCAFPTKAAGNKILSADWNNLPKLRLEDKVVSREEGADRYCDGTADDVDLQAVIDGLS